MTILSLLLASALMGGDASTAPAVSAFDDANSVVRRYALSAVARVAHRYHQDRRLLPGSRTPWHDDGPEHQWVLEPDLVRDALEVYYGEELEYEGRMMWETEEGELIVRAPEALQARVRELVDFFADAASSITGIRVDVVQLSAASSGAAQPGGLVDVGTAARLIAQAEGAVETYQLQVRGNELASLDMTTEHSFFGDYDVEVAQGAYAFDPRRTSMSSGVRMEVGAYPAPGGCRLALLVRHGTPTGPVRSVPMEAAGLISNEGGTAIYSGPEQLESLAIAQRTFALNTLLPDGQALVLRSSLDLYDTDGVQYLIVRREGAAPQAVVGAALGGGRELHLVRGYALSAPRFEFEGELAHGALATMSLQQRDWYDEGLLRARLKHHGFDPERELLEFLAPEFEFNDDGSWIVARGRSEEGGGSARGGEALRAAVEELQREAEAVTLGLEVQRKGNGLSKRVTCDLTVCLGQESAVVLGVESTRLFDFDIETAQGSSVPDPGVGLDIDGLALVLRVDRAPDGSLDVTLSGAANLLRETGEFDPRARLFGAIENRVYDRLQVDEVLRIPEGARRAVSIGNAGRAGAGTLELKIQVR